MTTATETRERPILFSGPMIRAILDGRKTQTRRVVTASNSTVLGQSGRSLWSHLLWDREVHKDGGQDPFGPLNQTYEYLHVPACHPEERENDIGLCQYRVRPIWEGGDRLYVKEGLRGTIDTKIDAAEKMPIAAYAADGSHIWTKNEFRVPWRWKRTTLPGMFMPRELSRITLEIVSVRVERVNEITEADAIAEGFAAGDGSPVNGFDTESPFPARAAFAALWDKLNGKRGLCPSCKGHGVVVSWSGSPHNGSLEQNADDCQECRGKPTGFGWDANPWCWVIEFKVLPSPST